MAQEETQEITTADLKRIIDGFEKKLSIAILALTDILNTLNPVEHKISSIAVDALKKIKEE